MNSEVSLVLLSQILRDLYILFFKPAIASLGNAVFGFRPKPHNTDVQSDTI